MSVSEILDQVIELTRVPGCSATAYQADIFAGERLRASVTADAPVDVVVCREEDYESWHGDGGTSDRLPPNALLVSSQRTQAEVELSIPDAGCYCLVAINWSSASTTVSIEISFHRSAHVE